MSADQQTREWFAVELERNNELGLAAMIRDGTDNSHGGTAAVEAIRKAVAAERERCALLAERLAREHSADGITGDAIADRIRETVGASATDKGA